MRIIAKRTLLEFWEQYPDVEQPLLDWYDITAFQEWHSPDNVNTGIERA